MSERVRRLTAVPERHLGKQSTFGHTAAAVALVSGTAKTLHEAYKAGVKKYDATAARRVYIVTVDDREPVWPDVLDQMLLLMMTTNHIDQIDKAIRRPGRCDVEIEIGYLTDDEIPKLYDVIYQREPSRPFPSVAGLNLTAADLIETCKQVLSAPTAGEEAFRHRILETRWNLTHPLPLPTPLV